MNKKLFLTLKDGLENSKPHCFLCSKELSSGPDYTTIEVSKNSVAAFHSNCYEIVFKFFDALFSESLKYYLETGIKDLFNEEGMIKSAEL